MERLNKQRWVLAQLVATLCAGCGASAINGEADNGSSVGGLPAEVRPAAVAHTYNSEDGNRLVSGRGALPATKPIDIPLPGEPKWLLSALRPVAGDTVWVSVLQDGRTVGFVWMGPGTAPTPIAVQPARLDPNQQPTLVVDDEDHVYVIDFARDGATRNGSIAIVDRDARTFAYVNETGELVLVRDGAKTSLAVDALPNTRIFVDEQQRVLLLAEPSSRYTHDVLGGDSLANAAHIIATQPTLQIVATIAVPPPQVIEGNALMWTDMTGDGQPDIVLTVSDANVGSALHVYDDDGELIAKSDPIGTGFRWHHQLAAAPFQTSGQIELAVTRTPHIGGVNEFYHLDGARLIAASALLGNTSHALSTAYNIDMALAGDFDDDAQLELLIPSDDFTELGAIVHRQTGEVVRDWTLPIGGKLTTNLSAAVDGEGRIIFGVGHNGNALRLWR